MIGVQILNRECPDCGGSRVVYWWNQEGCMVVECLREGCGSWDYADVVRPAQPRHGDLSPVVTGEEDTCYDPCRLGRHP